MGKIKTYAKNVVMSSQFWIGMGIIIVGVCLLCASKKSVNRLQNIITDVDQRGRRKKEPGKKKGHSTSVREERSREIFEAIFPGFKFPPIRPDILKNVTGHNLEYDGFNPDIKTPIGRGLAFEFDGRQHTHFVPRFHKSMKDLEYQMLKDQLKKAVSKKEKIVLINIPDYVTYRDLESFILGALKEHGIKRQYGPQSEASA